MCESVCARLLLNNRIPLALKHMGIKLLLANGMIVSAEQFEMCFSVPVLHTDLGGLPSPNVISPSGHTVVRPGQCFQMRQTDPPPPSHRHHCSSHPLPDSRIHTGWIKHRRRCIDTQLGKWTIIHVWEWVSPWVISYVLVLTSPRVKELTRCVKG